MPGRVCSLFESQVWHVVKLWMNFIFTERNGRLLSTPASYSGGFRLKSTWSADRFRIVLNSWFSSVPSVICVYGMYISYWSQTLPSMSFWNRYYRKKNTCGSYILLATGCGSNQNSIEIERILLPAWSNISWTNCRYCTHLLWRLDHSISWHYVGLLRRMELDIGHYSKPGLANFSPQEGHILLNDSPEGRTRVYIYQNWGI